MRYDNRFQNSEGLPMDPMARGVEFMGQLPKTYGMSETLREGDHVQLEGRASPEWKSPKDSIVSRQSTPPPQ